MKGKMLAAFCLIVSMAFFVSCIGAEEDGSSSANSSLSTSNQSSSAADESSSQTHTHVWVMGWSKDETGHWYACTDEACTEKSQYAMHTPEADDGDCTTAIKCSVCQQITVAGSLMHQQAEDDGDIATPVTCLNCDYVFVPAVNWEDINYDFSSADDKDAYMVSSIGAATINGIVADENATDGYALHTVTGWDGSGSGLQIKFNDVDVSDYSKISLKLKATNETKDSAVAISVNGGEAVVYNYFADYTEVNLKPYISGNLNSIEIYRSSVDGTNIYIDSVTLVDIKDYDYTFSAANDVDLEAASSYNSGTVSGIVPVDGATDGYALQASTVYSASPCGVAINMKGINLADYESITVRFKYTNQMGIYLSGAEATDKCVYWNSEKDVWHEVELIALAGQLASELTTLDSIVFGLKTAADRTVYIDSITLVPKTVE